MAEWQAVFDQEPFPGEVHKPHLTKYRDKRVKAALCAETHTKCAYCERKFGASSYGDVEHILPKSVDWKGRLLDYDNLTMGCSRCNGRKGDEEPRIGQARLIHPYLDDPESELEFEGPAIRGKDTSVLGKFTVLKLDLNRLDLLIARAEAYRKCEALWEGYVNERDDAFRQARREELDRAQESSEEFALMKRHYFQRRLAQHGEAQSDAA